VLADLEPFLRARGYDLLHCHFGPNGVRGVRLREALAARTRVVTTFHGYDLSAFRGRGMPAGYGRLFRCGDLFLPVSQHWADLLIQMGCPPELTHVHRMGVDLERFAFAERHLGPDEPLRVVSVARLVEKKGIQYGIRAVESALARGLRIEYDILGDGPLRPSLERLVSDAGIGAQVRLLGWGDRDQVAERIRRAHLFLAPSVTATDGDKEGIPVVLMEAMATGLPVLASHHSGIPELVHDGRNGLLVPEGDSDALARALIRVHDEPSQLAAWGRSGRAEVERNHDHERQNDRLVELFEGLLESPGRGAAGRT